LGFKVIEEIKEIEEIKIIEEIKKDKRDN